MNNKRVVNVFVGTLLGGYFFLNFAFQVLRRFRFPTTIANSSRSDWIDTGISVLAIAIAASIASFVCRQFFGGVKPREWKESFERTDKSAPPDDFVLRYPKSLIWLPISYGLITLLLLSIFSSWIVPIQQQEGRESVLQIVLFFGIGAGVMGWMFSRPILRLDRKGVSTLMCHLPWEEIQSFDVTYHQGIDGQTTLLSFTFKKPTGKRWRFVYVGFNPKHEREELLRLLQQTKKVV